jgi:hypothetical protein
LLVGSESWYSSVKISVKCNIAIPVFVVGCFIEVNRIKYITAYTNSQRQLKYLVIWAILAKFTCIIKE